MSKMKEKWKMKTRELWRRKWNRVLPLLQQYVSFSKSRVNIFCVFIHTCEVMFCLYILSQTGTPRPVDYSPAICLSHKDRGISLSALLKTTTSKLAFIFPHDSFCAERQARDL